MQTINVKQLRSKAGLSQEDLARVLGTSWVTVSRWETKSSQPDAERLARLKRLKELIRRIGKAIPEEELVSFLTTPHRLLRGYRPSWSDELRGMASIPHAPRWRGSDAGNLIAPAGEEEMVYGTHHRYREVVQ